VREFDPARLGFLKRRSDPALIGRRRKKQVGLVNIEASGEFRFA